MKRLFSVLALTGVASFLSGISPNGYGAADESIDPTGGTYAKAFVKVYNNSYDEDTASKHSSTEGTSLSYMHEHVIDNESHYINQTATGTISAKLSNLSVNASIITNDVHGTAGAFANLTGQAMNIFTLDIPSGYQNVFVKIPFSYCFSYKGEGFGNGVLMYVNAYDGVAFYNGDRTSHGSVPRSHCGSGVLIKYTGTASQITFGGRAYMTSMVGSTVYNSETGIYSGGATASVNLSFSTAHLQAQGFTCTSSGGDGEGCEEPGTYNSQRSSNKSCDFVGNPINFSYGYKYQNEADYSDGVLSLARSYRSDSTWTNDNIGKRWTHNFDRKLTLRYYGGYQYSSLVDSSGSVVEFTRLAGVWSPVYSDTTSTFEPNSSGGYIYTLSDGTKEYYDTSKRLARIEYLGGEALDFSYDGSGNLISVVNRDGQSITFSYASDLVSQVTTPAGVFDYAYDGRGNLIQVTKPDLSTRQYHYEDANFPNALTGITDENGNRYATYTYDSDGRAIRSEHYGAEEDYDVSYNVDDSVTVTNPLGKQTTYHFDNINGLRKITNVEGHASASCAAANKGYTYTPEGWLKTATDWEGNVTSYDYDTEGRVTEVIKDFGGLDQHDIDYTYISGKKLIDTVTQGNFVIDYDYDAFDRVSSVTRTDTTTSEARTQTYSYYANTTDANGNTVLGKLQTVDGARTGATDTTTYAYDANSRLYKVTNALGHVSEITSFDSADRPLTIKDANGVDTVLTYDALGRVLTSTSAHGTPLATTTTYTYDDNGNVTSVTSAEGVTVTYGYNELNQLETITDDAGNSITYTHDAAGNITSEVYKDVSATLKYTHTRIYDELSRLIESVDANIDSTAYAYDLNSNMTSITDGENNATSYAFDGLNRLVQETNALNGVTAYGLNEFGDTEGVTDPRSNTTSYTYNAFGDVLSEVSPDRGTITYTVDKAGNVTSITDARNVVTNYTYDALNRLTGTSYPSDSSLDVTLTYDSASGCGVSKGRLCQVDDASGTTTYIYDSLGRLTDVTETRGSLSFTTSYAYNADGALTGITLPSGRDITYGINANGEVSSVTADVNTSGTTLASGITYLPFGGVTGMTYGNGVTLTNTYNTAYQLTAKQHGTLFNHSYTYDNAGNITATSADTYTYDDLYRLTQENADSYTYDAIGNRLTDALFSYTYPSTSSRLSDIGSSAITTDAAGNITQDASRTYTINAAGQLEHIGTAPSYTASYSYDANNQRTSKTVSGTTTHYVHGMNGLLYGEYDASGNAIREYVYLGGEPLAQIDKVSSSDVLTYLHTDHLGTPRAASDTSGNNVWSWDSDAFGNGVPSGSRTVNLRFAGQYYDTESGLHYNWNRYYDPTTGRYISSDPIGLNGGLNTFAYVAANPVMYIDPEGLKMQQCSPGDGLCHMGVTGGSIGGGGGVIAPSILIGSVCGAVGKNIWDTVFNNNSVPDANDKDDNANGEEGGKSIEDILGESYGQEKKEGNRHGKKDGGMDAANEDFDDVVDPDTVQDLPNGGRTGKTNDGRRVNVYPNPSSDGEAGIEVIDKYGNRVKVKYF